MSRSSSSSFGDSSLLSRLFERVRLVGAGGGFLGGRGLLPGRGGEGGGDGVRSRSSSSVGMTAGFSREIEIFSGRPPGIAIRYEFSDLEITL